MQLHYQLLDHFQSRLTAKRKPKSYIVEVAFTSGSPDKARQIADAFGLFGPPERCAERLLQAREDAGVEHVFLFPAHDLERGYDLPESVVEAFERVIRPRLGG